MVRGVKVLQRRNDGCVAKSWKCGGVLNSGESEGADFLAQHTLLQVCHPESSMLAKGTTIKAWQGVWE